LLNLGLFFPCFIVFFKFKRDIHGHLVVLS
jgi:hypothetical protein